MRLDPSLILNFATPLRAAAAKNKITFFFAHEVKKKIKWYPSKHSKANKRTWHSLFGRPVCCVLRIIFLFWIYSYFVSLRLLFRKFIKIVATYFEFTSKQLEVSLLTEIHFHFLSLLVHASNERWLCVAALSQRRVTTSTSRWLSLTSSTLDICVVWRADHAADDCWEKKRDFTTFSHTLNSIINSFLCGFVSRVPTTIRTKHAIFFLFLDCH